MRTMAVVLGLWGVLASGVARADEGMWTFNNFPRDVVKKRYGFTVTDAWLDKVRLAAVRFNSGGSGSFVSPRGLVMTNHHVGADCINKLAKSDRDYIKEGFYAKDAASEISCPDLELNVLVAIDDVTAPVKEAEQAGMTPAHANQAKKEKMAALEKACSDKSGERCDVVTLYQGGLYHLYQFKKYTDVRLVFAPEFGIAFFGGDPDNFEYPRFDLDVAFFRVYEKGQPVRPASYLPWGSTVKNNELTFVAGHPGNTERLDTVAQLELLRDTVYPLLLDELRRMHGAYTAYAAKGEEEARQARTPLFGVENALKAIGGYHKGLADPVLMAKKKAEEAALKQRILADPAKKDAYGKAWDAIAESQKAYGSFYKRWLYLEGRRGNPFGSTLFGIARHLVRAAEEKEKPSGKRLREYRDSNLASLELSLFSTAPIYDGLEVAAIESAIVRLGKQLGPNDPVVLAVLDGKSPGERARAVVAGTRLKDPAVRKALYADAKALDAAKDPMLALAKAVDFEARVLRKRYEDEVESVVQQNQGLLARALFELEGLSRYPDATFTLRLSFGKVAGYVEEGHPVAPWTTLAGLYARAKEKDNQPPWQLPPRWGAAEKKLKLGTPMNFVSTHDIIGGNSGSPVVNRSGQVVGLIFDGNIHSLPGVFVYDDKLNRAVSVHAAAIVEALRKVYDAAPLADELSGKGAKVAGKKQARR